MRKQEVAELDKQYVFVVGEDADKPTLDLLNTYQPADLSSVALPCFFIAQDEMHNIAGAVLRRMPDSFYNIQQQLLKPTVLDAELTAKVEGLLQPPSPGIIDTISNLHLFLEEHQGKLIVCVST